MLAAAARLCGVQKGDVCIRQGDAFRCVISLGTTPEELAWLQRRVLTPGRAATPARALMERQVVQVLDQSLDRENVIPDEVKRPQTVLAVPLLREGEPIGVITLVRGRVEAFSERQVALIRTFADQAVIAIENARLLTEQREALEQQTATAEILQIINSSPGDLAPVFDGILQRAIRLCEAVFGNLWLYDGESFDLIAAQGPFPPSYLEMLSQAGQHAGPNTAMRRAVLTQQTIQIADYQLEQAYLERDPVAVATAEVGKARTILAVPMVGEARALGVFFVYRQEVRSFSKRQIALLQNFAAQAAIAMENARLLSELTRREQELSVTFEHMGDGVVMFDSELRIAAWNRNFQELLDISDPFLATRPSLDDYVRLLVERGEVGHGNPDEEIVRYRERASETVVN